MRNKNDLYYLKVTATPTGSKPSVSEYPFSADSAEISGSAVPKIARENQSEAIDLVTKAIDYLKNTTILQSHKLIIEETEEINRGIFSHMDLRSKFSFDNGTLELEITGKPIKEKRIKRTTIKIVRDR
jgi:hypothetical protein